MKSRETAMFGIAREGRASLRIRGSSEVSAHCLQFSCCFLNRFRKTVGNFLPSVC